MNWPTVYAFFDKQPPVRVFHIVAMHVDSRRTQNFKNFLSYMWISSESYQPASTLSTNNFSIAVQLDWMRVNCYSSIWHCEFANKNCTCQESCAVMPLAKNRSDYCPRNWMTAKRILYYDGNLLMKYPLALLWSTSAYKWGMCMYMRAVSYSRCNT